MNLTEFFELLNNGEANWLDWKRQLDSILEQQTSSHSDWNKGKGTLLKDIAALANAISPREKRYLIRGVEDHGHTRTFIGVIKRFDDAIDSEIFSLTRKSRIPSCLGFHPD
jgi:predicted HTH transcriptional regulator